MKSLQIWMPIQGLKDGYLYHISARNSSAGIWQASSNSFQICGYSWGENYLDSEDHWDFERGTAKPIKEVEKAPEFKNGEGKLKYLYEHSEKLYGR